MKYERLKLAAEQNLSIVTIKMFSALFYWESGVLEETFKAGAVAREERVLLVFQLLLQ